MRRVAIIAVVLLAVAAATVYGVWYSGAARSTLAIQRTLYDTNADGNADLVLERIGEQASVWRWDRDGDGRPEVVGYDCRRDADGSLQATGQVTAWDLGGDGILDDGTVAPEFQALLRSPELAEATAAAGPGNVELVDMDIRAFVRDVAGRYDDWRLSGFRLPILGAHLPDADRLLPGAKRAYRFGIHQGFDMYPGHVGVPTGYGAPVIAAKSGAIIRADTDYPGLTPKQYAEAIATSRAAGGTPEPELDLLRGRQVWIDHGSGITTLYAHLSGIEPGLTEGSKVEAGQIIGFVGNSGTKDGAQGTRIGAHLHFELRIDGHYFGQGQRASEIRAMARRIFGLPED